MVHKANEYRLFGHGLACYFVDRLSEWRTLQVIGEEMCLRVPLPFGSWTVFAARGRVDAIDTVHVWGKMPVLRWCWGKKNMPKNTRYSRMKTQGLVKKFLPLVSWLLVGERYPTSS